MSEITEDQRLKAIADMIVWNHRDPTVKIMVRTVLAMRKQPSVGHLARFCPDDFDMLYEECSGIVRNDL